MGNCRWGLLSLNGHIVLFGRVFEPYGLVRDADLKSSLGVENKGGCWARLDLSKSTAVFNVHPSKTTST